MLRSGSVLARSTRFTLALEALLLLYPGVDAAARRRPSTRSSATAQETQAEPDSSPLTESPPTLGFGPLPTQILSRNELVSLSKKHALDLAAVMVAGDRARETAARERDLIRLSCVQDHLLQMKLAKTLADDALAAISRPDIRQDELRLRHEFRSVEMGVERVNQIYEEMMQCSGADTLVAQDDQAQSGTTPVAPSRDPTAVDVNTPQPERPASASPYY